MARNNISPYLVSIESFEVIASKVSWIPVPSFCGYIWPKKTPRYDGTKKCRAINNMWTNKTASNVGWAEIKIKPTEKWKSQFLGEYDNDIPPKRM